MSNPYNISQHQLRQQGQLSLNNKQINMYSQYSNRSGALNQSQYSQGQHRQQPHGNNLTGSNSSVHGKQSMLMANNDVFTIGPYKARKDKERISVIQKYEVIGYIAAGTYGKVYKVKRSPNYGELGQQKSLSSENRNNNLSDNNLSDEIIFTSSPTHCKSNSSNDSSSNSKNYTQTSLNKAKPIPSNLINDNIMDIDSDSSIYNSKSGMFYKDSDPKSKRNIPNSIKKTQRPIYYAIKKFKTEREGFEQLHYTGISQSACREMSLCRELSNNHLTKLIEIFMEKKSIYLVYEYAEHDLLQIIHFHSHPEKRMIPQRMIRSIMWQILDGVSYLHQNWILHRDLKPANIMVTSSGVVKVGDLGLARKFHNMVQTLYTVDKVVVTIWYRAPELMLGAKHYMPAIDLWAVGCIFAELIGLQPIFKGEEAKMDSKKTVPFQANQLQKIIEVLGTPSPKNWPNIEQYPEFEQLLKFPKCNDTLPAWYHSTGGKDKNALNLLYCLLKYDPLTRIDALQALDHDYFTNGDYPVCDSIFDGLNYKYPARRIHTNDNDIVNVSVNKVRSNTQQQNQSSNASVNTLGGLGVNRRILAAAAAAAAAVSNNGSNGQSSSRKSEPYRKRRK
ncbi:hypothetical protein TPHA_0L01350 [Tetrapisispora phaffii CBS 4417]|uniref:Cyclin-dependent kinase 8 n=1 Tax=Tetrapisispora phaffii (strain ATCC 24235 / CBS 4417 / NBRC 1672 / NRRL Y-8282 / UCD 70-5) TaxID=1071381 RepID=G8C012_TETPH|nr:hypothetical protein TPHA_0L01350 [Tetrapisispora phaffii CBS 4417]CCE65490.1 hypothetical protein TPHA_0L01350 [Tetrapisispora phaffii CBS 4417]